MTFKEFLARLHPLYKCRQDRLALVRSIKLPMCPYKLKKVSKWHLDVHPELDHYLTFPERMKLLTEAGWIKHLDGNHYYVADKTDRLNAINAYLASTKLDLRDDLKVSYCGLDFT